MKLCCEISTNRLTNITLAARLLASLAALPAAGVGGPVRSFDPELWVSPDPL